MNRRGTAFQGGRRREASPEVIVSSFFRSSPPGEKEDAYESFIDTDGFPTSAASPLSSFSTAGTSNSSAWAGGRGSNRSSPSNKSNNSRSLSINKMMATDAQTVDWPSDDPTMDWPDEEEPSSSPSSPVIHKSVGRNIGGSSSVNNRDNNSRVSLGPPVTDAQIVDWPTTTENPSMDWPEEEPSSYPIIRRQSNSPVPSLASTSIARDQQIFRRTTSTSGSLSTHSVSRGSVSIGRSGGELSPNSVRGGGIVFAPFDDNSASKNSAIVRSREYGSPSIITGIKKQLDNIAEAVTVRDATPRNVPGGEKLNGIHNKSNTATSFRNGPSSLTTRGALYENKVSPPVENTAGNSLPTGVVGKLVTMFASKSTPQQLSLHQQKQQEQHISATNKPISTSRALRPIIGTSTTHGLQHTNNVQFHESVIKQSESRSRTGSSFSLESNHNTSSIKSPTRSSAQSSDVTTRSGDSSSYVPTGWPGTVDKRGKTYAMPPSYSESEESSLASPQRRKSSNNSNKAARPNLHLQEPGNDDWLTGSEVDGMSVYDDDQDIYVEEDFDDDDGRNTGQSVEASKVWRSSLANITEMSTPNTSALDITTAPSAKGHHSYHTPRNVKSTVDDDTDLQGIDVSGSKMRVRASGKRLPNTRLFSDDDYNDDVDLDGPLHLSEELLRAKDEQSAPPREGGAIMLRGFRGFIDKTKDVPNLMDDVESEASPSTIYTMQHASVGLSIPNARGIASDRYRSSPGSSSHNISIDSDIFDGIQEESFGPIEMEVWKDDDAFQSFDTQFNPFSPVNGKTTRQNSWSEVDFLDTSLNISAVTNGSANTLPHQFDMDGPDSEYQSLPDLSMYYIQPDMVQKMVRAFRKICTSQLDTSDSEDTMLSGFENLVDTKKAFALFEMRSRIMETDIDRGLERKGGTNVVDDIALTPYFQAASRVRDAVIVSKAWRDGATPKDVITAHFLTRRSAKAHFVCRRIPECDVSWFEEVKWLDDTDFMIMRCQSLGLGMLKGFEMFTIGDCQSMLLKMTSDNCLVSRSTHFFHFSCWVLPLTRFCCLNVL